MSEEQEPAPGKSGKIIQIDKAEVHNLLDQKVRKSVEETLNGLLDAEADELCGAQRYERSPVLNGCTQQSMTPFIPRAKWVIGIKASVGDSEALEFVRAFYRVAAGRDIPAAFEIARTSVKLNANAEVDGLELRDGRKRRRNARLFRVMRIFAIVT